jgi:hypothetical protein
MTDILGKSALQLATDDEIRDLLSERQGQN